MKTKAHVYLDHIIHSVESKRADFMDFAQDFVDELKAHVDAAQDLLTRKPDDSDFTYFMRIHLQFATIANNINLSSVSVNAAYERWLTYAEKAHGVQQAINFIEMEAE